ncbi:MAG: AAA family ATPase [Nitrososphaerota archaeon]|nr:AAA family ATPase [Nitrososphaerota archaeon]
MGEVWSEERTELMKRLSRYGLTELEVRALAALASGAKPASLVAKDGNIPRPKAYEILEGLQEKGLIEEASRDPMTYRVIPGTYQRMAQDAAADFDRFRRLMEELTTMQVSGVREVVLNRLDMVLSEAGFRTEPPSGPIVRVAVSSEGERVGFAVVESATELTRQMVTEFSRAREGLKLDVLFLVCDFDMPDLLTDSLGQSGLTPTRSDPHGLERAIRRALEDQKAAMQMAAELEERLGSLRQEYQRTAKKLEEHLQLLKGAEKTLPDDMARRARQTRNRMEHSLLETESLLDQGSAMISHAKAAGHSYEDRSFTRGYLETLEKRVVELSNESQAALNEAEEISMVARRKPPEPQLAMGPKSAMALSAGIIGRRKFVESFESFLNSPKPGANLVMIVGKYGSGKSFAMNYFAQKINEDGSGIALVSMADKDFRGMINDLLVSLLQRSGRENLPRTTELDDAIKALGELLEALRFGGTTRVYWFIDELERAVAALNNRRDAIVEGLRRLMDVLSEYPLTVVVSLTPGGLENLRSSAPWFTDRASGLFGVDPWTDEDFEDYISRTVRLDLSEDALALIREYTEGNPRRAISLFHRLATVRGEPRRKIGVSAVRELLSSEQA